MATKNTLPRPGAEVTLHGLLRWPDAGGVTVFYRRCTVVSFGAKQGAFRDADDSKNVRHRIYPSQYARVSAGHGPDANVVAALVADQVADLEARLACADAYEARTVAGFRAALDAIQAGRIVVRDFAAA